MELITEIQYLFMSTLFDVLPIIVIIFGFQFLVIRKPVKNLKKVLIGLFYVIVGITLFLIGLEEALFPLGKLMAEQLTDPAFIGSMTHATGDLQWNHYYWVYVFAFAIGMSTTIAEPALIAVAIKAHEVSGGAIGVWGLRIAVAFGVAIGISLGA